MVAQGVSFRHYWGYGGPTGRVFTSRLPAGPIERVKCFRPSALPKEWDISIEIWPLLSKAREELARLDGIGKHMPNHEILLTPLQKREAIRSSSLEGTYATPEQLAIFDIEPREPKSDNRIAGRG